MIITGQPIATNFRARRTWNKQQGWQTTHTMRGIDEEIEAWIGQLQQQGYTDIEIIPDSDTPYSTLNFSVGHADDGSSPETQVPVIWNLLGNDLEKDLWNHPKLTAVTRRMTGKGLAQFRRDVEIGLQQKTAPEDMPFFKAAPGIDDPRDAAILTAFYRARLEGVEVFPVSQYVLKKTQIISFGADIRPSQENINKMFTSAKLKEVENIPDNIPFVLPAGFWLKRTPTVEEDTRGKFQISQEYWNADGFNSFLYDLVQ